MKSLQIRQLPDQVYLRLSALAKDKGRSISQQALQIIANFFHVSTSPRDKRRQILSEIKAMPKINLKKDPTLLVREDRENR